MSFALGLTELSNMDSYRVKPYFLAACSGGVARGAAAAAGGARGGRRGRGRRLHRGRHVPGRGGGGRRARRRGHALPARAQRGRHARVLPGAVRGLRAARRRLRRRARALPRHLRPRARVALLPAHEGRARGGARGAGAAARGARGVRGGGGGAGADGAHGGGAGGAARGPARPAGGAVQPARALRVRGAVHDGAAQRPRRRALLRHAHLPAVAQRARRRRVRRRARRRADRHQRRLVGARRRGRAPAPPDGVVRRVRGVAGGGGRLLLRGRRGARGGLLAAAGRPPLLPRLLHARPGLRAGRHPQRGVPHRRQGGRHRLHLHVPRAHELLHRQVHDGARLRAAPHVLVLLRLLHRRHLLRVVPRARDQGQDAARGALRAAERVRPEGDQPGEGDAHQPRSMTTDKLGIPIVSPRTVTTTSSLKCGKSCLHNFQK